MIVPTSELNEVSEQSAPLQVFGYSQVDEAFRLIAGMLPQEVRLLSVRLANSHPYRAETMLAYLDDALSRLPLTDLERHQRIARMMRSIMAHDANAQNEPETTGSP
jgi:hypothetical protein